MKITIPEDYSEITVGQYKALWKMYERAEDAYTAQRRCIELLAGLKEYRGNICQAKLARRRPRPLRFEDAPCQHL